MSTFFVSGIARVSKSDARPQCVRRTSPGRRGWERKLALLRAVRHALGLVAVVCVAIPVFAAKPAKETKEAKDSGPVLMSRTGGSGGAWSDVKELQQAAAKGNPKAEAQFGEMLLRGSEGVAKDESRGVALLEKAARAGQSSAAFRIGMLLANGESGVANDPARALAYFRAAAAGGEKEAFFNIGAAYGSARGVKRDYGEALGWLIVARQRGADASAENNLRAQIKSQPTWIAKGEKRAKEIEQEFTGKKATDFLPPPAPFSVVAEVVKPAPPPKPADDLKPSAGIKPAESLKPVDMLKPIEVPKPTFAVPPQP